MLIPQMALGVEGTRPAEARSSAAPVVRDVALQAGGVLRGQVLNAQGAPAAMTKVVLAQQGQALAEATTDAQGRFSFSGLKGGVYQVATTHGASVYRAWNPGTAPPAAQADALIVNGEAVIRGQCQECDPCSSRGGLLHFLSNPWVLGGLAATAIAIPLVVDTHEGS
jgi:hypothetical protein